MVNITVTIKFSNGLVFHTIAEAHSYFREHLISATVIELVNISAEEFTKQWKELGDY